MNPKDSGYASVNESILRVFNFFEVFNNILSPMLEKNYSVETAMWFGAALCLVCLIYSGVIWVIDRRWVRQQRERGRLVEQTSTGEKIDLSRLSKDLHFIYWQLTAACFLVYGSIKPFQQICPAFFESRWGFSLQKAGLYLSDVSFLIEHSTV